MVRAVVGAVVRIAVAARVALVAVAREWCDTSAVSRAVVWAGWLVTVFTLVSVLALRAIRAREAVRTHAQPG